MEEETTPGQQMKRSIIHVVSFIVLGLVISTITIELLSSSESLIELVRYYFIIIFFETMLLMTVNTHIFKGIPYERYKWSKLSCWIANCILVAIPMSKTDAAELGKGFLYTLVLIIILSLSCAKIPREFFEPHVKSLMVVHFVVLLFKMSTLLFPPLDPSIANDLVAAIVIEQLFAYSLLLVCNTHRLILNATHPQFDPLFTAFVLFTNASNLLSSITVFLRMESEGISCNN